MTYQKIIITKVENGFVLEIMGETYAFETLAGLYEKIQAKIYGAA